MMGEWKLTSVVAGELCGVNWNLPDATVVCRQLGFRGTCMCIDVCVCVCVFDVCV